jgi:hypothetical protein
MTVRRRMGIGKGSLTRRITAHLHLRGKGKRESFHQAWSHSRSLSQLQATLKLRKRKKRGNLNQVRQRLKQLKMMYLNRVV